MTNKTTSAIDLVERGEDALWLRRVSRNENALVRVHARCATDNLERLADQIEADADTITRLQAALEELLASCTRTTPALHDDCGTRLVTAPTVDALEKARAALRSSVGGE